jgi:hypothetical protein
MEYRVLEVENEVKKAPSADSMGNLLNFKAHINIIAPLQLPSL